MAGKKTTIGASGEAVRANVVRLREAQNLSYAEMTRQLTEIGRPIPELGLRNIERGQRKVDVDELVALAHVLGVAPVTLLMPNTKDGDELLDIAGFEAITARQLWNWLRDGSRPVGAGDPINLDDVLRSTPRWAMQGGSLEESEELHKLRTLISRIQIVNNGND
ncbi:helix-turn-helix domain-containing protein [Corynebacterium glutamicum]|uniref:helix-turn-helix domain-containing protein n=1 Tax=Corynebacterium glutamicum TaxID=1718 RepID=UPI001B8D4A78|nr:helix-turn-helix transcriptional regulator [Corynebacterium glutamicum]